MTASEPTADVMVNATLVVDEIVIDYEDGDKWSLRRQPLFHLYRAYYPMPVTNLCQSALPIIAPVARLVPWRVGKAGFVHDTWVLTDSQCGARPPPAGEEPGAPTSLRRCVAVE